jgi:hypothetical protein
MNAVDFIIGTGVYACSMYLKEDVSLSDTDTDPNGDDPVVPVPPSK